MREHGTRARYVADQCRCDECRAANAAYNRTAERRRQHIAWGARPPVLVDAEPARRHVRTLQAAGMGWRRIAAEAGLDASVVRKLVWGDSRRGQAPSRRLRPDTAERLLAVRHNLADHARTPAIGTQRRLQALVAIGWSQANLARRLGFTSANFTRTIRQSECVYVSTARAVRDLYERLWNTAPPEESRTERIAASCARNAAARHGWPPPMAWDDETIDDPDATPLAEITGDADEVDPVAVERAIAGWRPRVLRPVDRAEAIRRIADEEGIAPTPIAKRLRCNPAQVKRVLAERDGVVAP